MSPNKTTARRQKHGTLANVTNVYTLHGQNTDMQYCFPQFPRADSVYNNFQHKKTRKTSTPSNEMTPTGKQKTANGEGQENRQKFTKRRNTDAQKERKKSTVHTYD